MRARRSTLAIGILTALIGSTVHAEEVDVQAQLVEQGQYWQARGNSQRATEVWQKVLLLDKSQVNALYGMGLAGVRQNKPQQAQQYLARLQGLSPVPWQARQLLQDIAMAKPENQALLDEARRLVDAGQRDKASDVFRRMFNGMTPEGSIGREYYNNLAFNDAGWAEAKRGMERLMRENPDDSILALFYGKQLARHEETRAEGARVLARLSKHVDIAGDADESWRLALVWMGPPTAAQVPLFEEFLKAHPEDQGIREQMNKGRQKAAAVPQDTVAGRAMQAMERGDQAEAERLLQERLATHPDDPDALGGLGVLRQQQNRLGEAEQLLGRVVARGAVQWKPALDSVRYWTLIQRGRDLQTKGQVAQAQDLFAQALRLDPKNLDGRLAMADSQAGAGQFEQASAGYRQVLTVQPGNAAAVRGLVSVLSQTGRADEALRMLDSLSPAEQAKFGDQGRLRSLRAIQLAGVAEQRGDMAGASSALLDAVKNDPENVWTHFSLARLYLRTGDTTSARRQLDGFVKAHPGNADALYASALLSVEMERWSDAQASINQIPVERRSAAVNDLADQIALTTQVNLAVSLIKGGQRQEALALLDRLQAMAAGNPDRIGTLASAYVDAGDPQRALALMQPLVTPAAAPSANVMLQYAAILLRTGEDAQVYAILTGLQNQSLSVATCKRFDDVLVQYRVRQADRLREGGELAAAYDVLAPALVQRPEDVAVNSALARMYVANGESVKALALYKPLVQRNPQDTGVLLSAADAALQARDNGFAEKMLGQFSKLENSDPAALTEGARIYRALGKTNEATALLRRAVAIEASDKQRGLALQGGNATLASNPFRRQRQPLAANAAAIIPPPAESVLQASPALADAGQIPASDSSRRNPLAMTAYNAGQPAARMQTVAAPLQPVQQVQQVQAAQPAQRLAARGVDTGSTSAAQQALNDIVQSRTPYVAQGLSIRSNDSESGLSQLTDVEAPLEVNLPMGDSRAVVRVTPVSLSAGDVTDNSAARFGGGASSATGAGSQRANGVGVALGYVDPAGFKADLGTTPIGFKYADAVGGVSLERALEGSSSARYGVALSRRAVTDSLTSFAGTTDGRDGRSWGGVTANGVRGQLSYDDEQAGLYTYGSVHRLMGHNVASNTRVELGAGAYRYLLNQTDNKLTGGVSATILSYANNQNFFTYGNGGYFSPQAYLAVGVPVSWARRADNFTFLVKGAMGVQYFQQDSADYFPTDSALQAASGLRYAKQSKTGLGYSLEGTGEYRFGPRLFVGGTMRLNNSNAFRELNVGMYVRYTFEDMKGSTMALPVSPYASPYAN